MAFQVANKVATLHAGNSYRSLITSASLRLSSTSVRFASRTNMTASSRLARASSKVLPCVLHPAIPRQKPRSTPQAGYSASPRQTMNLSSGFSLSACSRISLLLNLASPDFLQNIATQIERSASFLARPLHRSVRRRVPRIKSTKLSHYSH